MGTPAQDKKQFQSLFELNSHLFTFFPLLGNYLHARGAANWFVMKLIWDEQANQSFQGRCHLLDEIRWCLVPTSTSALRQEPFI